MVIEYFQGYSSDENTWEPRESFVSEQLLIDYHRSKGHRRSSLEGIDSTGHEENIQAKSNASKSTKKLFLKRDFYSNEDIEASQLSPKKVLNIFHMVRSEKDLVAQIKFEHLDEPKFVHASWANQHCPQLVIQFYESRIFWRERR